ncbi:MAG TPA: winged helix-turn-helix transcriptional regulator, partial [Candidatus Thermoplasmatota archaeon]|nr:winged helix-turn-helix transcriptional regulator [Candidatus Thermoplasmatota archaeon]
RAVTTLRIGSEPGWHQVTLERAGDARPAAPVALPDLRYWAIARGGDSRGCEAGYLFAFAVSDEDARTRAEGCTVLTRDARDILAQARAATGGRGAFDIPLPREGDRGVFGPDGRTPFEWRAARFADAHGRALDGHELAYRAPGGGGSMHDTLTGATASVLAPETTEVIRFAPGDATPVSWSRTRTGTSGERPGAASAILERELRYDAPTDPLACLVRSPLQGSTLRPGQLVDARDVCPAWGGPAWRAAAPIHHRGFRALPLYQLEETPERLLVARLLYVDGNPYPIDAQRYVLPSDGPLREARATLERYHPAGEPLPTRAAALPPPRALAPLDPMRGPEGAPGLAAASDAAALLPRVRLLALGGDAALIGARYEEPRAGAATLPTWHLVFGARAADAVFVACAAPARATPACRETLAAPSAEIAGPPRMGAAELPARAASFEHALSRWDGERPTYALYRAWGEPVLALGDRAPSAPAQAPFAGDEDTAADFILLDLASARTRADVEIIEAVSSFDPASLAPVRPATLLARAGDWADADSLPYVVGGGIGLLALVALGLLLYSRLVRARVLDDETRAAIHEVVMREPGLHASGILERLGKRSGVGEYHLDVLVREGYLATLVTPGFRRYFVSGRHAPAQMRALAALREGQNERLLGIIRAKPGIELRALAREAGVSVPYASKSVARLAEAGLVDKVQAGRVLTIHASEA